jgi:hypothetical protein
MLKVGQTKVGQLERNIKTRGRVGLLRDQNIVGLDVMMYAVFIGERIG